MGRFDKRVLTVSLQVKQGRQISEIDPHVTFCRDDGFGMQGDTGSGSAKHAKIIGPVTHGDNVGFGYAEP